MCLSRQSSGNSKRAYDAGDFDRVAELETQIWFDGAGRTPAQVNPAMRQLAYDMNRHALTLEARHLGKRLPDLPGRPPNGWVSCTCRCS